MKKALIALLIVTATACDRGADKNKQTGADTTSANAAVTTPDKTPVTSNPDSTRPMNPGQKFDAEASKVGDRVAGLQVADKKIQPAPQTRVGVIGSVKFKGELQLTGSYRAHYEYPQVKEACFWLDPTEWPKVPRVQRDDRLIWFCFTNKDQAIQQLGPLGSNARATIVIDDYTTNVEQPNVWDTARLVRVVKKEKL